MPYGHSRLEIANIKTGSVYEDLLAEIDPEEIPPRYIDRVTLTLKDGSVIDIPGEELHSPLPVGDKLNVPIDNAKHPNVESVRIYIDIINLEIDAEKMVAEIFKGKFK